MDSKLSDGKLMFTDALGKSAGLSFDGANYKAVDAEGNLVGLAVKEPETEDEAVPRKMIQYERYPLEYNPNILGNEVLVGLTYNKGLHVVDGTKEALSKFDGGTLGYWHLLYIPLEDGYDYFSLSGNSFYARFSYKGAEVASSLCTVIGVLTKDEITNRLHYVWDSSYNNKNYLTIRLGLVMFRQADYPFTALNITDNVMKSLWYFADFKLCVGEQSVPTISQGPPVHISNVGFDLLTVGDVGYNGIFRVRK